jgi:hypothetical protein
MIVFGSKGSIFVVKRACLRSEAGLFLAAFLFHFFGNCVTIDGE